MLGNGWLDQLFATDRDRVGARRFLQSCKERWEELRHRPISRASLDELYASRRVNLLAQPKRLLFDADTLQWLVQSCSVGLADLQIEAAASRYFVLKWKKADRTVLFGFEAGSNWKRWEAIAREAEESMAQNPALKAVYFRGTEQPPIPGPTWKVAPRITGALRRSLHLVVLTREDFAELYAGYDLYAEALGGDIPPYSGDDVLQFLRERFAHWWTRILGPIDGAVSELPAKPPHPAEVTLQPLAVEVRAIVASQKFLSVDEVIERLMVKASKEEVLQACGYSLEIRVHAHPRTTVLQWQCT
jgi:hypothetical protein